MCGRLEESVLKVRHDWVTVLRRDGGRIVRAWLGDLSASL
jgi:hypothetical protein